eukprot:84996_1
MEDVELSSIEVSSELCDKSIFSPSPDVFESMEVSCSVLWSLRDANQIISRPLPHPKSRHRQSPSQSPRRLANSDSITPTDSSKNEHGANSGDTQWHSHWVSGEPVVTPMSEWSRAACQKVSLSRNLNDTVQPRPVRNATTFSISDSSAKTANLTLLAGSSYIREPPKISFAVIFARRVCAGAARAKRTTLVHSRVSNRPTSD